MSTRTRDVAAELKLVIRLAGRDPEGLEGKLPALSSMHRVQSAGDLDDAARVHFILHRLVPEYSERLPAGRDGRAIRELLAWEEQDGQTRSLTTRYHKASAHLVNAAADFGRRQEPRLLLECARRFVALDHEDRLAAASGREPAAEPPAPSAPPPSEDGSGILGVHRNLDHRLLVDHMVDADEIVILNTWIPDLNILDDALVEALVRGTYVSILMLYPDSDIARLRSRALQREAQARLRDDRVGPGVRHCLDVLAAISRTVGDDARKNLRVRLYHSLPSISVYSIDDRAFFSVFLHGQLAVNAPQIEIYGQDSLIGQAVFRELETLWRVGLEFEDLEQWEPELAQIGTRFGIDA